MTKRKPKPWEWQQDFDLAQSLLAGYPGKLEIATDPYVAFRYIEEGLRIVFYPHRTTAGHYHIRTRVEPCNRRPEARRIQAMLDKGAGPNCTFTWKYQ